MPFNRNVSIWLAVSVGLVATSRLCSAQSPVFSAEGPDALAYGAAEHFPVGRAATLAEKKFMVGDFSHFDTLFPTHTIAPAARAWEFQHPATMPEIRYLHAGEHYTLKDYLAHQPVTGLLIVRDDQMLFEGYQYARTDQDHFTSQSMAKSMVGMLVGIAVSEHAIGATSDIAAKYVNELKETDYGKVSIRDLLHMSSGVRCHMQDQEMGEIGMYGLVHECKQEAPGGTQFQYSAADSQVLGLIVSRAVKMPLARYLQDRIWQKIGTEFKATWTVDASGQETAFCCVNATLRDYARFGRMLADDGAWQGEQLVPKQWLLDATTVKDSDAQLVPGKSVPFYGYGYQIWIFPGPRRMFALIGANGQRIFVDPQSKLLLVQTAVMEKAVDRSKDAETIGLWLSLVRRYGGG